MMKQPPKLVLFVTLWLIGATHTASAQVLELEIAEQLALSVDPITQQLQSTSDAFMEQAISDGELPDPEFSVSLLNFPVDTFDQNQNPTTQAQFGISQKFPSYGSLTIISNRTTAHSALELAKQEERRWSVLRDARLAWLDVFYLEGVQVLLEEYKGFLEDDIKSIEASFSTGQLSTQKLLDAELTSSLLDDRALNALWKLDQAKAALGMWVGEEAASRKLPERLPIIVSLISEGDVFANIENHPSVRIYRQREQVAQSDILIAEADYMPKFGIGATYGFRQDGQQGQDRPDLLSFKVNLSIPLFTGTRQDRRLSARKMELSAVRFQTNEHLRKLVKLHASERAALARTQERLENLDSKILKRAKDNIEAAMTSYQFDASDFDALVRARVSELEVRLTRLKLLVDRSKSLARLNYLIGDPQ